MGFVYPGLPPQVPVLTLWARWAAFVAAGVKTIETRRWRWTRGPSWLVIHAGKKFDGEIPGSVDPLPEVELVTPGCLCALVWVCAARPLLVEDREQALVYQPGLEAIRFREVCRLAPVPYRGRQRIGYVSRDVIMQAILDA